MNFRLQKGLFNHNLYINIPIQAPNLKLMKTLSGNVPTEVESRLRYAFFCFIN